ncbi:hypothetical protein Moror_12718 [Moniliophthora roreri MCA 2997]|uniref:Uncharacterized protein n=1 Tax=Moniliophthora roreri (strain MCA 2997) TaxID=1381753 RepID=V2XP56_MONRO|nr:hypothetical protein Moror_12718 [Moniliophthora roreri MCA 2997]
MKRPAVWEVLSVFLWINQAYTGDANFGDSCSQSNNRLQVGTYQFYSDCDLQAYCAANSTCAYRGCRSDDFPFGYPQDSPTIPPKCPRGQFCPDEMDVCQPLLPVGSPCQLNRDDQCQGPPNFKELADHSNRALNVNGSVCLNNVCMWANATLNQECVVENIAYIAYTASGEEFIDIVSRGNCRLGLYCDSQSKRCMKNKKDGDRCDADKECESMNCLNSSFCGRDAAASFHLGVWVYAVVGVGIAAATFGTLLVLFLVHRRQRDIDREKRMQYWREQNAFHQNLNQMREAVRASILSFPGASNSPFRDGNYSDESYAPMNHQGTSKS